MSKIILSNAVEMAGGQVALAAGICRHMPGARVKQGHVWKWLNLSKEEVPPPEYVIAIAQAVGWRITPHDLRPDIYPHPTDGMPKAQECGSNQPQPMKVAA